MSGNREIRFRAWYKPLSIMLEPGAIESINFEMKTVGAYIEFDDKGFHKLRLSDFDLMQYTGLKDKNGKEIYEGDRLKHTESFDEVYFYQVKWNEVNATFDFEDFHTGEIFYGIDMIFARTEVIGNIWEHPHLIKEAE